MNRPALALALSISALAMGFSCSIFLGPTALKMLQNMPTDYPLEGILGIVLVAAMAVVFLVLARHNPKQVE